MITEMGSADSKDKKMTIRKQSRLANLSTMIPRNKRGAVTIALGQEGLAQLRAAAKQSKTKPAAVAKALIFSGIDRVLTGELKIETKPRLTK